jgi:hypothetical protein
MHWIGGRMGPRAGLDGMGLREFLTLPRLVVQPALSLYTDWANVAIEMYA